MRKYKVKIVVELWMEVTAYSPHMAITHAELDVEEACNKNNWEIDNVMGEDAEEIDD